MMNRNIISAIALLAGMVFSYYLFSTSTTNLDKLNYSFDAQGLKSYDTKVLFIDIFLNNLTVGLLLSIFGFFTGGILTLVLLFWNGYLLGSIYVAGINMLSLTDVIYYSKHLPLELCAFLIFSNQGFKGFEFYKKALNNEINVKLLPNYRSFALPILLLLIASIVETL